MVDLHNLGEPGWEEVAGTIAAWLDEKRV